MVLTTISVYVMLGAFAGGLLAVILHFLCEKRDWKDRYLVVFFICNFVLCAVALVNSVWK